MKKIKDWKIFEEKELKS